MSISLQKRSNHRDVNRVGAKPRPCIGSKVVLIELSIGLRISSKLVAAGTRHGHACLKRGG
jgi:hypothetical protein